MSTPLTSVPLGLAVGLVAVGGAAGAVLRWAVGTVVPAGGTAFPWATFAVNVTGSLLLALLPLLLTAAADRPGGSRLRRGPRLGPLLGPGLLLLLGPGLLGGFTTLSASSEEARLLVAAGQGPLASAYLLATLAAALTAVHAAGWVTQRRQQAGRR